MTSNTKQLESCDPSGTGVAENDGHPSCWMVHLEFVTVLILLMAEILHQLIGSLPHFLQGFIHPKWCRISAINSSKGYTPEHEQRVYT